MFLADETTAQIYGCTDPLANNYNPSATQNDGTCSYNMASVTPFSSFSLAANLTETSGLISWNSKIWTHNDSDDRNIYALDSSNGNLIQSYLLNGVANIDWEEISQDDEYVYIGDFGNNRNGNRTDLKILRIDKQSILSGSPVIETINFSYSNQENFAPAGSNNTDFDCEAFIVSTDSIYLFTKQWISLKTSVYSLSKIPGTHVASLKSTPDVQGLITGATFIESKKLIALCGYSIELQPFIYLLYGFSGNDFSASNKRKNSIDLPFHQVEGITTSNGSKYFISNEDFAQPPFIRTSQKLHILDLSTYLSGYLNNMVHVEEIQTRTSEMLFPNPATDNIYIKTDKKFLPVSYFMVNQYGKVVLTGKLSEDNPEINISGLSTGMYILKIGGNNLQSFKVLKK